MAKVSIIIPTYNVEMYLEECMESVTHQTLRDIEIICINDAPITRDADSIRAELQEAFEKILPYPSSFER